MASRRQQITRKKTAESDVFWGKAFEVQRRLCHFLSGGLDCWQVRAGPAGGIMMVERRTRLPVERVTLQSYSDGLSVVYQMTAAEVRHSARGAVSLFPSVVGGGL